MRTILKAEGPAQERILKYIEDNASNELVLKINKHKEKDMNACWRFILAEARKRAINSCACLADEDVFGLAIHFLEEDAIKADSTVTAAVVTVPKQEPKQEPKKENVVKFEKKQKKETDVGSDQLSFTDFWGESI